KEIPRLLKFIPYLREKRFAALDDELENLGLDDSVRDNLHDFPSGQVPPRPSSSDFLKLVAHSDGKDLTHACEVPARRSSLFR
ncbi:hypothetical protein ACUWC2_28800, partial [Klebsiella pneumoniae]|uniref:hypothetical protein n=1 Tax=Klebsiella pneumoniae TaxID=573 RepID=UPI004055704B